MGDGLPPGLGRPHDELALVTEKPGKLWLVDVTTGASRRSPASRKWSSASQGGFLDVVASPNFAGDQMVYLTYSEPSKNGGSGLALARARLVQQAGGARLDG